MARVLPAVAVCLLLLPVEAALLPFLGPLLSSVRADLALCAVLWLAVGPAGAVEGAVGAYACGTIADLLYAVQPGLFAFLALLVYVLVRVGSGALDVRGPASFAALCGIGALVQAGLAYLLLTFVGQSWPTDALPGVFGGAALTAAVGAPVYLFLRWTTRVLEREESSLLR
jgi:hypothetical protein